MPEDCADLSEETARAGDEYYRTVTTWATEGGRSPELGKKASRLATIYNKALQKLIDCLHRMRRTLRIQRKIDNAAEFQALLQTDLELLESREETT
ncbi:MAG: hypothetical protein ABR530_04480 [Pyrinomonadaceae bacterium]